MPASQVKKLADKTGKSVEFVEKKWNTAKETVKEQYPDLTEDDDRFWALTTQVTKKMIGITEDIVHRHKRIMEGQRFSRNTIITINRILYRMGHLTEEEYRGLKPINENEFDDMDWPVVIDDDGSVEVGSETFDDLATTVEDDGKIYFDDYPSWIEYFDGTAVEIAPFDDEGSYEAFTIEDSYVVGFWDETIEEGWALAIIPGEEGIEVDYSDEIE